MGYKKRNNRINNKGNIFNNQNYILGDKIKTGIISEFLVYKSDIEEKKEKHPFISLLIDLVSLLFVSTLNGLFHFLNNVLRIHRYISLFFVNILGLLVLLPFVVLSLSSDLRDDGSGIILGIVLYLVITYRVIKSNLGKGSYRIVLYDRYGVGRFNYTFIDNKSSPGMYGETKSFYIKNKNNRAFLKEFLHYITIVIFIFFFIFILYERDKNLNNSSMNDIEYRFNINQELIDLINSDDVSSYSNEEIKKIINNN